MRKHLNDKTTPQGTWYFWTSMCYSHHFRFFYFSDTGKNSNDMAGAERAAEIYERTIDMLSKGVCKNVAEHQRLNIELMHLHKLGPNKGENINCLDRYILHSRGRHRDGMGIPAGSSSRDSRKFLKTHPGCISSHYRSLVHTTVVAIVWFENRILSDWREFSMLPS